MNIEHRTSNIERRTRFFVFFVSLWFIHSVVFFATLAAAQSVFRGLISDPLPKASGAAPTYLLEQDMEGTGTPSGWTDNGVVDWDYTTSPIAGAQSMFINNGSAGTTNTTSPTWTAVGTTHFFSGITIGAASGNAQPIEFLSASAEVASFEYRSSGALRINHGTAFATTGVLGAGTYYIWIVYTKATVADGTMDLYHSSTTTKPGSPTVSITTGTSVLDIDQLRGNILPNSFKLDYVRVDNETIGSAPP